MTTTASTPAACAVFAWPITRSVVGSMTPAITGTRPFTLSTVNSRISRRAASPMKTTSLVEPSTKRPWQPPSIRYSSTRA